MRRILVFLIVLFAVNLSLKAQTFEIRAVNKGGGVIGVEMRATSGTAPTTSNFITDMRFGLKWQSSYNVNLGPITTSYNIVKSDPRLTSGAYHFQAFSAANTPFNVPANWTLNSWVEIMSIQNTLTGSGLGTFEIAEMGFDATTNPNIGIDLVDFTPTVAGSAINVPLPVSLVSFEAVPKKTVIQLKWKTRNEHLNKGFEVERSDKPNGGFRKIAWVASKGNGGGDYTLTDNEVLSSTTYYYRLKEVDQDGEFRYSEVRTAELGEMGHLALNLIPNPADRFVQVVIRDNAFAGKVVVKISDAKGTVVLTRSQDIGSTNKVDMDIFHLPGGQYFVSVENTAGLRASGSFLKR